MVGSQSVLNKNNALNTFASTVISVLKNTVWEKSHVAHCWGRDLRPTAHQLVGYTTVQYPAHGVPRHVKWLSNSCNMCDGRWTCGLPYTYLRVFTLSIYTSHTKASRFGVQTPTAIDVGSQTCTPTCSHHDWSIQSTDHITTLTVSGIVYAFNIGDEINFGVYTR